MRSLRKRQSQSGKCMPKQGYEQDHCYGKLTQHHQGEEHRATLTAMDPNSEEDLVSIITSVHIIFQVPDTILGPLQI
jgi:hypothetical protein